MFAISSLFTGLPTQIATLLIAMIPIGEYRASIPVAMLVYDLPWWSAYIFSVIGASLPVFFLVWVFPPLEKFFRRIPLFDKFLTWLFAHTRHRADKHLARYGAVALVVLAGLPLPLTGAWTAGLAGYLFGIPKKTILFWSSLGVALGSAIVILLTVAGIMVA